ncbi:hypothetical protein BDW74DRAFT_184520 [Aspergillus multicolor]|uniref:uncharacterized protein n=1 Tax=Aspergillus multicolor TaxID=41759 RepID=UPI003CCE26B4
MSSNKSAAGKTLLLFGPQSLTFNKRSFDKLRSTVSEGRLCRWISETVAELPTYWTVICQHLPQLKTIDGEHWLADLDRWFRTGAYLDDNRTLPNTLLTPRSPGIFSVPSNASTLGFCTGVLSAFAVSSLASQQDFDRYGPVAVRLAMLFGALVDAQDASDEVHGRAKSYATAWNTVKQGEDLARIIDHFPEAYISVRYDEKRATITTSQITAQTLVQQLKAAGIVASEVGLRGRFHHTDYHSDLASVIQLCDAESAFQFPDAFDMVIPSYTNLNGDLIQAGRLHHLALRAILFEESNWYTTFAAVQESLMNTESSRVISFGPDRCVPPSFMRTLGPRLVQATDLDQDLPKLSASVLDMNGQRGQANDIKDDDIAVIGMAIKVAGADGLAEFWQINCEGKSQHIEVPQSHFGFKSQWRELDTKRKWYGNFIDDAAYQAVEQSGYFSLPNPDNQIGCYIDTCAADYEHNIACHAPNAFTATGNLRSFMSGKVSHYFGWTRPGMTIDTACSASAVAIHMAFQAILNGECTNPLWFQNLATVSQNQSCTPIFIPNSPSLSTLFQDVVHKAQLKPDNITVVEAHGTGTPVGDPAEYESTSGVISLIKMLMMMHEGWIPPQASYANLSHHIKASPKDLIEIPTSLKPWNEENKAALINNYGAPGSNASMVVTQPKLRGQQDAAIHSAGIKHPFWIPALDGKSLSEYCRKLSLFLRSSEWSKKPTTTLSNLSFNLSRQANQTFPRALIFSCSSLAELECQLSTGSIQVKAARPVVLCFDWKVYETVKVLRTYLDQCDAAMRSLGLDSIYHAIFQQEAIEDTIKLQTALFAVQYSCAKCWMDSGVTVAAVVGHSFGEITALCISGVLSLKDTIKLVAGRAKLVRDSWGKDRGAMVAVEGDLASVQRLVAEANRASTDTQRPASIACYNGPRRFTLAGSMGSIDKVAEIVAQNSSFASLKTKRLNVTNAFHSSLVEPLIPSLEELGQDLTFKKPVIPLERATESRQSADQISSSFTAEHLRHPVYFNHALRRLAQQYPSCIYLEAGSNSTITHLANPVNLAGDSVLQNLSDTTLSLWKEGLRVSFWPHHALQTYEYSPLILPPYQSEKHRHWLDLKVARPITESAPVVQQEQPLRLWSFVGYQDLEQQHARFRINTMTKEYNDFVSGHMIAQTAPICLATLEIDMAIEAIRSLRPDLAADHHAQVLEIENHVPICVDPSLMIVGHKGPEARGAETTHVKGKIRLCATNDPTYHAEFARYEHMVSHKRCLSVLKSDEDADDVIQGRNVYRTFAEVVDYAEMYRGVKKVVGKGDECASRVQMKCSNKTWLDVTLSDCFSQLDSSYKRPKIYNILAAHHRESDKLFMTDVYVMFGTHYIKVAKASMSKILTRLTAPEALPPLPSAAVSIPAGAAKATAAASTQAASVSASTVREIIANVSGLEADEIEEDSELADFDIDSLMGMELAREVESVFKCTLDQEELMEATSFRRFVRCITSAVYPNGAEADDDSTDPEVSEGSESDSPISTPRTSASDLTPVETPLYKMKVEPLSGGCSLELSPSTVLEAFGESKLITDQFMRDRKMDGYSNMFLPAATQLCVALVLEAFEKLGVSIASIPAGEPVLRVRHVPQQANLVNYLYEMFENDGRLFDTKGTQLIRRANSPPEKSSDVLLQEMLKKLPDWTHPAKLTYFSGKALADVLQGKTDGRELVTNLYCHCTINHTHYELISLDDGPLKILEMGAGTGGSTMVFVPFLAQLNVPVEYTFTDLSPSMVAQARRKWKSYSFMKFAVHDIEKPVAEELRGQHIVIASNAVHVTHNLEASARSIRTALRPDGFLMMLEMTGIVPYIELAFGLLEGWWLFDDGRRHAIASETRWEKDLQSARFRHVDWTDGAMPENDTQKIIIALASGPTYGRLPKAVEHEEQIMTDDVAREAEVNRYVAHFPKGCSMPVAAASRMASTTPNGQCVLVTGATGSLGSHLVEQFAVNPEVHTIVCVNRRGGVEGKTRQQQALTNRGIELSNEAQSKLKLGVSNAEYAFEPQFHALRNLIDLARDVATQRPRSETKVRFQLVSSIGVVGQYPIWSGQVSVPEERMEMRSVLPVDYCEAKLACERILDATLHKYPEHFRPMSVRLGQIAGSRTSGFWNPIEHFSFLIKSCQTLKALPSFGGILSWIPVNDVAGTLKDLLLAPANRTPYPIYHIDNPKGQPWPEMIEVLADALDVPFQNIIPFDRWVRKVRELPLSIDTDNPAGRLIGFLDHHFLRMSCGGLLLDTTRTREHSPPLAVQGPVSAEVARKYVQAWKAMGFLHA